MTQLLDHVPLLNQAVLSTYPRPGLLYFRLCLMKSYSQSLLPAQAIQSTLPPLDSCPLTSQGYSVQDLLSAVPAFSTDGWTLDLSHDFSFQQTL